MPIEIPPVVATNPVVQSPVEAKTFDTWFLTDFRLVATPERKFDAEVFWALGRIITKTEEIPVEKTVSKPKLDEAGNPVLDDNGQPVMEDVVETVMETVTTNSSELSDTRRNCYVRDLLGDAQLAKHPEILQVLPGFLSALEAISKREGSI